MIRVNETPVLEGSPFVVMAVVTDATADAITQADVSTITYKVTNKVTATAVTGHNGVSLTVADVVYDTLQTDNGWDQDATGFNFRHLVASTATADAGAFEYLATITLTSGYAVLVRADVRVIANSGN